MASKEQLIIASAAFLLTYKLLKEKQTKHKAKRRWWITELYRRRNEEGHNILNELKVELSTGQFNNFVRMSSEDFEVLIQMIGPKVMKKDTRFRNAIPVSLRLAITLRFLATGDSYTSLQYVFKVSRQAISTIVMEVCPALIEGLRSHVKVSPNYKLHFIIITIYCGFGVYVWKFSWCTGLVVSDGNVFGGCM